MTDTDNTNTKSNPPPQNQLTPQDSLRELNRLLESALRMGGGGGGNNTEDQGGSGGGGKSSSNSAITNEIHANIGNGDWEEEWRLDTARQLCEVRVFETLIVVCFALLF